ncbi:MAG: hypothetical protein P4L85_03495 [Paludisphaera borealis]|uniref:hypothetical protein n=1 Tax=Paludisphaera borealis TaxID=1387353 RepID=UPI00283B5332|nr:hypothetical protein [Paludisphaera borealis]MDR3618390.1 hypothetical protein [Paludisphaera borealis]
MSKVSMSDFSPSGEKVEKESTRDGFLLHVLGCALLLSLLGFVAPRLYAIYRDFGVPLPRATVNVFRASHLGAYLVPIFVALLAADRLVLKSLKRRGDVEWRRFYTRSVSTGLALLILWTLCAMCIPLTIVYTPLSFSG